MARDGDVLQRRMAAAQQSPQLGLCRARGGDAHPAVLREAHPPDLQIKPVADREPDAIAVFHLESRKATLTSEERGLRVCGIAERVPERPCGVLAGPRTNDRLLCRPHLGQGEVAQRRDALIPRDAVAALRTPLVGVGLDLRYCPVPREPARTRGTQQRSGRARRYVQAHSPPTMRHEPIVQGWTDSFSRISAVV